MGDKQVSQYKRKGERNKKSMGEKRVFVVNYIYTRECDKEGFAKVEARQEVVCILREKNET